MKSQSYKHLVVIIGAGPAGLSAAYEICTRGGYPLVLEQTNHVGGTARTVSYNGYLCDIGGHRFLTKNASIQHLWQQMLGDDLLKVPRLSRIYYQGKFFNYPLQSLNALANLGIRESSLAIFSYLKAQLHPHPVENSFEQWVSNRFGKRLYQKFFQSYTEKVWGIPCSQLRSDWAVQRIKGLSLGVAVTNALFGRNEVKSLTKSFFYPVLGPGMMWQRFRETIENTHGQVLLNAEVCRLEHFQGRVTAIHSRQDNHEVMMPVSHLISSMPLPELVARFDPPAPEAVLSAARELAYRAFLIIVIILDEAAMFPDQWLYIHSPDVKVGRIQNFKNWSAAMVPDSQTTSLGMEYFCQEGDEFWTMSDTDLINLAVKELHYLGLWQNQKVRDAVVLRQPGAYPVYDQDYQTHLTVIQNFLKAFTNLQTVGRNGMHRYNNLDHSMLTGILAARNLYGEEHDVWQVNEEEEYLEA